MLDAEILKFFDRVLHDKLMAVMLISALEAYLRQFADRGGGPFPTSEISKAIAPSRLLPTSMCIWFHAETFTLSTGSVEKQLRKNPQVRRK